MELSEALGCKNVPPHPPYIVERYDSIGFKGGGSANDMIPWELRGQFGDAGDPREEEMEVDSSRFKVEGEGKR